MSNNSYTLEKTALVDTFGSISALLEVLSTPTDYFVDYKSIRVGSRYSVDVDVLREFYASSECKVEILIRVVSESSNLPIHVVRLTKAGHLNNKASVHYRVFSAPYFRGRPKAELTSARTTNLITFSDLETVLLSGNMKKDGFNALSEATPKLRNHLFTCCGIPTQSH